MAMISNVSLPFPPEKMAGKQRAASIFSSLNGGEDNFVRNLGGKEDDGEIGVFGAEKYFNGGMDDESPIPVSISARKLEIRKVAGTLDLESMEKPKNYHGTTSVRSESSWNSKSALLQRTEKTPTKSKRNRGRSFLSRCKCSCCDEFSVDVMEEPSDLKSQNPGEFKIIESRSWLKEGIGETFTFPISKPEPGKFPIKVQISVQKEEEKKPRKSMDLFRKLESSAINGGVYSDAASDCSSDLFEIESLTGKSSCFHGRQSSDATSCFTHTTCYAPSEVSIDWSVVTASAGDFSAASDYDSDQKTAAARSWNPVLKRRPGIFLGCKSEKAVGVATDALRKNEKCTYPPLTRFEAETKVTGFSSMQRNQAHPLQTQVANHLEI